MDADKVTLEKLPVELLYEILLASLSHHLPSVNRRLRDVFALAPISVRAQFLIEFCILPRLHEPRTYQGEGKIKAGIFYPNASDALTRLLRYPICSLEVLQLILGHPACPEFTTAPEMPRRLFKSLRPSDWMGPQPRLSYDEHDDDLGEVVVRDAVFRKNAWKDTDYPLPFLHLLFSSPQIPKPRINTGWSGEYALSRAVHANFVPLIRFLLSHGVNPSCKDALPVKIAILRKDLSIVQMLVEREDDQNTNDLDAQKTTMVTQKRLRLEDRMTVNQNLLREAIRAEAKDVVSYFVKEKGLTPDMATLRLMDEKGIYGQ